GLADNQLVLELAQQVFASGQQILHLPVKFVRLLNQRTAVGRILFLADIGSDIRRRPAQILQVPVDLLDLCPEFASRRHSRSSSPLSRNPQDDSWPRSRRLQQAHQIQSYLRLATALDASSRP